MSPTQNPNPSTLTRSAAASAIDALLASLLASPKHRKAQLFEADDFLYLHLSLLRFPSTPRTNPHLIPLPHSLHPLHPSLTSLCLIAPDSLAAHAKSTAAAQNLPFDSILSLSDLQNDYIPFESRRRLCDSYDIFFAERKIITFLPRLIGTYFFKKRKIPVAVNLSRKGWPEAVREVCRSTRVFFGCGTGIGMKVGRVSMGREEIVDNLMAAVEGAVERVPKKWANVRCVYVKAAHSVALPIYQAVPELGMKIDVGFGEKAEFLDVERGNCGKLKKRKGRIHDVGYVGAELVDEREIDEVRMEKKKKKRDRFDEVGDGRRVRKRAKKIVNSNDDDRGDGEEIQRKKKVKRKFKKGGKDGFFGRGRDREDVGGDEEGNVMNLDDGFANVKKMVKKNEMIGKGKKVKKVRKSKLRQ